MTSDPPELMGDARNAPPLTTVAAWIAAGLIVALNVALLVLTVTG